MAWQAIARRGEGQFLAIAEDGGVQAVPTPYDKPLAELGDRMGRTYTAYGGGGFGGGAAAYQSANAHRQAAVESKVMAAAPAPAAADRAVNKAINSDAYDGDLMQSLENGSVRLNRVKPEDLAVEMQKLSPQAQRREIAKRLTQRKTMRAQILQLSYKREAFLAEASKKKSGAKPPGFDAAVSAVLRKELVPKGIRL